MTDDKFAAGLGAIIIGGLLLFIIGVINIVSGEDQDKRIQTYQNQLSTYILCVQKATDKSVCGKQPDVKNYL